jgi:hypothetical protein
MKCKRTRVGQCHMKNETITFKSGITLFLKKIEWKISRLLKHSNKDVIIVNDFNLWVSKQYTINCNSICKCYHIAWNTIWNHEKAILFNKYLYWIKVTILPTYDSNDAIVVKHCFK